MSTSFPSVKGTAAQEVSTVSLVETTASILDEVVAEAKAKHTESTVGKPRALMQLDIQRLKREGSRSTGDIQCDVSFWYYYQGAHFLESRISLLACATNGCYGVQKISDAEAEAPDFFCPHCNNYFLTESLATNAVFFGSRERIAKHVERLWTELNYHGCDIYAVIYHSTAMRKLQVDGVYGGMNKFQYKKALEESRRVTRTVYTQEAIQQDISNGSDVRSRMLSFLKEL